MAQAIDFFDTLSTSNGENSAAVQWNGGHGIFIVYGTFDSVTAKMQFSPDDGTTWIDVNFRGTAVSMTLDGYEEFYLPDSVSVRSSTTGGSGSVSIRLRVR